MQFYSYLWLRDDDRPYYAGKGFGQRAYRIAKGHRPPSDPANILIFHHATEVEAFESEREFIRWFGRLDLGTGCLLNKTSGGQGSSGRKASAETREKQACETKRIQTGRKHTPEHVEKVAAANRGKKRSAEHIAVLVDWHKTHPQTPEWKAKVEAKKKGRKYTQGARTNMSTAQKGHAPTFLGRTHTPEALAQQSAARKAYWERKKQNADV